MNLTLRETDILTLISLGMTSKDIANKLNISKRTVDGHRQKIIEKTGKKRAKLIIYSQEFVQ